jgi:hypothetical protein
MIAPLEIREPRRGAIVAIRDGKAIADAKLRGNGHWRVCCRIAWPWPSQARTSGNRFSTNLKFVATKEEAVALLNECASYGEAA